MQLYYSLTVDFSVTIVTFARCFSLNVSRLFCHDSRWFVDTTILAPSIQHISAFKPCSPILKWVCLTLKHTELDHLIMSHRSGSISRHHQFNGSCGSEGRGVGRPPIRRLLWSHATVLLSKILNPKLLPKA